MKIGSFVSRHVGPRLEDQNSMLRTLGAPSLNELIERVVPGAFACASGWTKPRR